MMLQWKTGLSKMTWTFSLWMMLFLMSGLILNQHHGSMVQGKKQANGGLDKSSNQFLTGAGPIAIQNCFNTSHPSLCADVVQEAIDTNAMLNIALENADLLSIGRFFANGVTLSWGIPLAPYYISSNFVLNELLTSIYLTGGVIYFDDSQLNWLAQSPTSVYAYGLSLLIYQFPLAPPQFITVQTDMTWAVNPDWEDSPFSTSKWVLLTQNRLSPQVTTSTSTTFTSLDTTAAIASLSSQILSTLTTPTVTNTATSTSYTSTTTTTVCSL